MGDVGHRWKIDGKLYSPTDISALILKKLVSAAQEQLGPITQAVITVPAQFSDVQRHATIEAGHRAGLERVDLINEPVAAALCHVLGSEGLWFTELAGEQRILVYDLGGGTFDLSLVRYRKNEVSVIATSGDLNLGGINWNAALQNAVCDQFAKQFRSDPRDDAESMQALALEVEQTKRGLSVRPRAALTCQHAGNRKTYQIELSQFEKLTKPLVERTAAITTAMLKENKLGWAHVDVVLVTGGASRMPMVRRRMKEMSGRTLNTTLSPDLSIAQGATYYAGMLLSNSKFARSILSAEASRRLSQVKQRSVNARALGILVRDMKRGRREPYYLIAPNTPLPVEATHSFGTVKHGQRRVNLQIVESGTSSDRPWIRLGNCIIDELPPDLPEASLIDVTISYDDQARVHVRARDVASGKEARTEIVRQENLVQQLAADAQDEATFIPPDPDFHAPRPAVREEGPERKAPAKPPGKRPAPAAQRGAEPAPQRKAEPGTQRSAEPSAPRAGGASLPKIGSPDDFFERYVGPGDTSVSAELPVAVCGTCKQPLDAQGRCRACEAAARSKPKQTPRPPAAGQAKAAKKSAQPAPPAPAPKSSDDAEEEFWKYVE